MSIRSSLIAVLLAGVQLFGVLAQSAKLTLSSNLALKLFDGRASSSYFTVANPTFTIDKTNSTQGQQAKEIVDFGFDKVYVLAKTGQNEGIDCKLENQCQETAVDTCAYNGQTVSCSKATTLMRFEPVAADGSTNKLSFNLVTPDGNWISKFGQNGVWGMSPKSPFWDFLDKTYRQGDSLDLSYKLALKSDDDMYRTDTIALDDKSQLTLNGRAETTDTAWTDVNASYSAWVWPNAKLTLTSGKPNNSMPVCIDNSVNAYFMVSEEDYDNLRDHVNGQLCEIEDGEDYCYKNGSNFANVDDMEITLSGNDKKSVSVNLGAFDFIHYDSQDRGLFGVEKLSASALCSQQKGVQFAVGRLFFTKAEMTIRSLSGGKFQLGFSKVKRETSIILPILLLVIGIVLILAIATIAYTQLPREEKKENGEYEEAADSPIKAVADEQ
jgi:hypothetical protein